MSKLFFTWIDPLIWQGFKKPLQRENIPKLKKSLEVVKIVEKLDKHLKMNLANHKTLEANGHLDLEEEKNEDIAMLDINEVAFPKKPKTTDKQQNHRNVIFPLIRAFGAKFGVAIVLKVVQDLLKFVPPQILKQLIQYVQEDRANQGRRLKLIKQLKFFNVFSCR